MNDHRVDQLWAEREINQLALNYAFAVDTRDWPLMTSLWVETSGPADFPDLDIHVMREMAPERFSQIGSTAHFVCNHLISFDGPDRAKGSVYCLCWEDAEVFFEQSILYQDDYERHDGKWLFLKRCHLLWWAREVANPMEQPAADWPRSQIGAGHAFKTIRRS